MGLCYVTEVQFTISDQRCKTSIASEDIIIVKGHYSYGLPVAHHSCRLQVASLDRKDFRPPEGL